LSDLTTANEDTICCKDILKLNARISLKCSFFYALVTCIYCIKDQPMHFSFIDVLWSPTCFGHSCGHLQGELLIEIQTCYFGRLTRTAVTLTMVAQG